jgi:hypothetical protein
MPNTVESAVAIIHGIKKSDGLTEPCVARIPITVEGNSCNEVDDITTSIIILRLALPPSPLMEFTARTAIGVEAFPSPKIFADIFSVMNFCVSAPLPGNKKRTAGRRILARRFAIPVRSSTEKKPSQNAYSATSSIASRTASCDPFTIAATAADGFAKSSVPTLESNIKSHILPITVTMYMA